MIDWLSGKSTSSWNRKVCFQCFAAVCWVTGRLEEYLKGSDFCIYDWCPQYNIDYSVQCIYNHNKLNKLWKNVPQTNLCIRSNNLAFQRSFRSRLFCTVLWCDINTASSSMTISRPILICHAWYMLLRKHRRRLHGARGAWAPQYFGPGAHPANEPPPIIRMQNSNQW